MLHIRLPELLKTLQVWLDLTADRDEFRSDNEALLAVDFVKYCHLQILVLLLRHKNRIKVQVHEL